MQAREEMSAGQVHELVLEQLLIRAKVNPPAHVHRKIGSKTFA